MNQTPAAIIILSSSILAYASTVRAFDTTGGVLGLAGLVLGIWGVMSLVQASIRDRELSYDGASRADLLGFLDPRRSPRGYSYPVAQPVGNMPVAPPVDRSDVHLSPEVKAQLSMASHLEGRERSAIVEEALRRYLPNYDGKNAA